MKMYKCEWHPGEYDPDIEDAIVYEDWFTEKIGYDEDDQQAIRRLEVNQCVHLGMGGHIVTRIQ